MNLATSTCEYLVKTDYQGEVLIDDYVVEYKRGEGTEGETLVIK